MTLSFGQQDDSTLDTKRDLKSACGLLIPHNLPATKWLSQIELNCLLDNESYSHCLSWNQASYQKCEVLPGPKRQPNASHANEAILGHSALASPVQQKNRPANPQNHEEHFKSVNYCGFLHCKIYLMHQINLYKATIDN